MKRRLPHSVCGSWQMTGWYVLGMYGILAVFAGLMWYKTRLNLRDTNLIE